MVSTSPTTSGPWSPAPTCDGLDLQAGGNEFGLDVAAGLHRRAGRRTPAAKKAGPASDLHPERKGETHVTLDDVSHVLDAVTEHQHALDAEAEGETAVLPGSTPQATQHLAG